MAETITFQSLFGLLGLQCLCGEIQFPHIFTDALIIDDIHFFHDTRREDAEMTADVLLGNLGIGSNYVVISYLTVLDLCPRVDAISVSKLGVKHV